MIITDKLKERFVRDCKVPIKLYAEPYFMERMELFNDYFGTLSNWELFKIAIFSYATEDDYFINYNNTKEAAINFIKENPAFIEFNNLDMNQYAIKNIGFSSHDIFHESNIGRKFASIDMRKANFSSMRHYNPQIFDGANTWEEFIGKFTSDPYVINSKYIREVIMGNCNPKKHITYEKYLMDAVLTRFLENGIDKKTIVYFGNDEIVIDITDNENYLDIIKSVVDTTDIPLRIDPFVLKAVRNENDGNIMGYIRFMYDGTFDFKCFTNYTLPFVIRLLRNEAITDNDLLFDFEGNIAKFVTTPKLTLIG